MAAILNLTTGVVFLQSWSGTITGATLAADTIKLDSANQDAVITRTAAGTFQFAGTATTAKILIISGTNGSAGIQGFQDISGADSSEGYLTWAGNAWTLGTTTTGAGTARGINIDVPSGQIVSITGGPIQSTRPALVTTSTDGLTAINTTLATNGVPVQISPRLRFRGTAWDTAASETVDFFIENLPASAATPTGTLKFGYSLNGAGATYPMTLTSAGVLAATTSVVVAGTTTMSDSSLNTTGTQWGINTSNGAGIDWIVDNNSPANLRSGSKRLVLGGAVNAATAITKFVKKVTSIADASATTILTVTIPNANHACAVRLFILSSNGSTDAFESNRAGSGMVVIERTSGKSAVCTAATLDDGVIATCATGGSATHTLAYSAVANAEGAAGVETVSIKVTIDDSGNLGANQAVVYAELLNAEATGCTIA